MLGVAVKVAVSPKQMDALLTMTTGDGFNDTVPEAGIEMHPPGAAYVHLYDPAAFVEMVEVLAPVLQR